MSGSGKNRGKGDYTRVGEGSAPAFVRLPDPGTVFAARAVRLAALAEGNPLGPYLAFLSRLVEVQHAAEAALPPVPSAPEPLLAQRLRHGMPPLSKDVLAENAGFAATLDWASRHASVPEAPEQAEQARARLLAMAWPERLALAEAVFDAAYPAEQLAECLYTAAAALQVQLTRHAALLERPRLQPVGDGACPVCGCAPVASMVVGWASADRARYCCCSLCGTMWNYVRIKCTACGTTGGIAYYAIKGERATSPPRPAALAAPTSSTCIRTRTRSSIRSPMTSLRSASTCWYGKKGSGVAPPNPLMIVS